MATVWSHKPWHCVRGGCKNPTVWRSTGPPIPRATMTRILLKTSHHNSQQHSLPLLRSEQCCWDHFQSVWMKATGSLTTSTLAWNIVPSVFGRLNVRQSWPFDFHVPGAENKWPPDAMLSVVSPASIFSSERKRREP